jgi:uncharacterized iron-regulated membrane protein
MRVPVWLTLGVALLVCLFGAYRIRLAFRSDAEDERARQRKGLYAMGRRTHFLVGVIYLLLGGALVATSFGWNPFSGVFASRSEAPRKEPATMSPAPSMAPTPSSDPAANKAPASTEPVPPPARGSASATPPAK